MTDSVHRSNHDDLSELLGRISAPSKPVEGSPRIRVAPPSERYSAGRISKADLADLLGVTARSISEITGNGILRTVGRGEYDLKGSVRAYSEWVRKARRGSNESTAAAKLRKETALAEKAELANAIRRRDYVPAAEVLDTWSIVLRDVRLAILAIPGRIQAQLPDLSPADLTAIDREIRDQLAKAAEGAASDD